jgi:hypothetical protein
MLDTTLIAQAESIEDPLIYQLTHLILRSNKVRIETMNEIEEAELEDPVLPNKWIFHKDAPEETSKTIFFVNMKCSKTKIKVRKMMGLKMV